MNLRQLKHAVTLAEEQSFGRAAEKLHITQSALSRSIQALEGDIELVLFDRHASGVWVTVAGQAFLTRAKALLRQANGLKQEAELLRGASQGNINLGAGPVALHVLLPKVLPHIMAEHPSLEIHVDVQPAVQLLQRLLDEQLEFFLADDQQFKDHPAVEVVPLMELSVGLFVRKGHPLLGRKRLQPKHFADYSLASPSFVNKQSADAKGHISPILQWQWAGQLSCEYMDVLVATVKTGDAVLLTAVDIVENELAQGSLVQLTLAGEYAHMGSNVKLIKLTGRSLSPVASLLLDAMQKVCGQVD